MVKWKLLYPIITKNLNVLPKNAKTVVLESELDISGKYSKPTTETYGRYLGFVWVDGVLLNLELVELAYTNSTLSSTRCPEIYKEYFLQASFNS